MKIQNMRLVVGALSIAFGKVANASSVVDVPKIAGRSMNQASRPALAHVSRLERLGKQQCLDQCRQLNRYKPGHKCIAIWLPMSAVIAYLESSFTKNWQCTEVYCQ